MNEDQVQEFRSSQPLKSKLQSMAGVAGVGLGGYSLSDLADKVRNIKAQELMGYHTMYHGTSFDNVDSIKSNGLLTRFSGSSTAGADIEAGSVPKRSVDGRVFLSNTRNGSLQYVNNAHIHKGVPVVENINKGILKVNLPHEIYQRSKPDRLLTLNYSNSKGNTGNFSLSELKAGIRSPYNYARTFKEDIPSKYIKGGSGSRSLKDRISDLRNYYSTKSGRIRAGKSWKNIGLIGASGATVAGGIHSTISSIKSEKSRLEEYKGNINNEFI